MVLRTYIYMHTHVNKHLHWIHWEYHGNRRCFPCNSRQAANSLRELQRLQRLWQAIGSPTYAREKLCLAAPSEGLGKQASE